MDWSFSPLGRGGWRWRTAQLPSARDARAFGDGLLKLLPFTSRETEAQKRWEHGQSNKDKASFQSLDVGLASEPGLTALFPSLGLPLCILPFSK